MKATGIVRRIDELGRVVIPKEIRRTLRIREGDPLEIFVDREGGVILKKYSMMGELAEFAKGYADSIHQSLGHTAAVCDRDAVIAVSGTGRKELSDKPVHEELDGVIRKRLRICANASEGKALVAIVSKEDSERYTSEIIIPIISAGDAIGAVLLLSREDGCLFGETEMKVCETAASFMGKQMES